MAIELTHLATLFHDDVMDEAEVRRGRPSVNSRWSNSVAILTGDFLFAQASRILADLGPEAVRIQAETFSRLVAGQLAETIGAASRPGSARPLHARDHREDRIADRHLRAVRRPVLRCSGRGGDRIAVACEQLGVAWQLSDDVIDIASDSAQSGKTPGTDLRQGVRTLPVLYALRSTGQPDRPSPGGSHGPVRALAQSGRPSSGPVRGGPAAARLLAEADLTDDALLAEALALLRGHPALAESRAHVLSWAQGARNEIMALPDVPARAAFLALCDFVEKRTG